MSSQSKLARTGPRGRHSTGPWSFCARLRVDLAARDRGDAGQGRPRTEATERVAVWSWDYFAAWEGGIGGCDPSVARREWRHATPRREPCSAVAHAGTERSRSTGPLLRCRACSQACGRWVSDCTRERCQIGATAYPGGVKAHREQTARVFSRQVDTSPSSDRQLSDRRRHLGRRRRGQRSVSRRRPRPVQPAPARLLPRTRPGQELPRLHRRLAGAGVAIGGGGTHRGRQVGNAVSAE